jgi:phosphonate transport system permease protein
MNNDFTLDQLTPKTSLRKKILYGTLLILTAVILVVTYVWTDINPLKLYEKRGNAFTYLFGRELTDSEKAVARHQAERLPRIIALEESRFAIKKEFESQGKKIPDSVTLMSMAQKRADEVMANQSPEEHQAIIEQEYQRAISEKKGGYFPPETAPANLHTYFSALIETVAIAIWGSLLAFLAAIPVSLFAAQNTLELIIQGDSHTAIWLRRVIQFGVRRFLDFCRGFNEFVMALIFVAVIGLGPFAGVLSLAIHTFGILGKVFSEGIEAIEPGQVDAVSASGASPGQVISYSVMPQIMPLVISYTLLRFESNVRSATILGFVGAGGIGFLMFDKINGYRYQEVASMMIMVIIAVTIIDYLCGFLRKRFV